VAYEGNLFIYFSVNSLKNGVRRNLIQRQKFILSSKNVKLIVHV
jgi:hypothetical protein